MISITALVTFLIIDVVLLIAIITMCTLLYGWLGFMLASGASLCALWWVITDRTTIQRLR